MGTAEEQHMSREFGDYDGGFFHNKVANAAGDARGGHHPLTLAWGKVLEAMQDVAWSISSVEAGDSSPSDLQIVSVKALRLVRDALYGVDALTRETIDVQRDAVRGIVTGLARVEKIDDTNVKVFMPQGWSAAVDEMPQRYALIQSAIDDVVRTKMGGYGWSLSSSGGGGGSKVDYYHYVKSTEAWRLKGQVRAALSNGDVAAALRLLDEP